jgi:hypothetical protein
MVSVVSMVKKISKPDPGIRDILGCSISEIPAPLRLFFPERHTPTKAGIEGEVLSDLEHTATFKPGNRVFHLSAGTQDN